LNVTIETFVDSG